MRRNKLSAIGEMIARRAMTQKEVAERLSITPQAVGRWARGEANPTPAKLEELTQLLSVTPDKLRFDQATGAGSTIEINDDEISIPVVTISQTVSLGDKDLVRMMRVSKNWVLSRVPGASLSSLQLINPIDDSMSPTIPTTGFVVVDRSITCFDRDAVFVFDINGQRYIKRVQRLLDGSINLISDNGKYPPQNVPAKDVSKITIIGCCLISCTANVI